MNWILINKQHALNHLNFAQLVYNSTHIGPLRAHQVLAALKLHISMNIKKWRMYYHINKVGVGSKVVFIVK